MSIKPDWWIRQQAQAGMIEPFEDRLVRSKQESGVISYGLSSFGYDLRAAPEWRIFVNAFNTVVDPKDFDISSLIEYEGETCIIPPNSFVLTRSVEYLKIPNDVMVIALGKSSYARCFRGDTRVALANGGFASLEEMAERHEAGERFFGYSIGPHGRMIVSYLDAPRYIGRDSLLELTLDNGEAIHCTPDHQFLMRDGRMLEATSLRPNDSLMPLYRHLARGYEMVYQPLTGTLYPTHRLADEWNLRHGIYQDVPDSHRHHVDYNRLNNYPWNIMRMNASDHIRLHNSETYGDNFDAEEHSAAIRDAFERLGKNPLWQNHFNAQQRERAQRFWHDEDYAQKRASLLRQHKDYWQRADTREAQSIRQQLFWDSNQEARLAQAERSHLSWQHSSDTRRHKQAELARSLRLRPEIDAKAVRQALDATGSLRGAAKLLNCDRSVFRRFPEIIRDFRGQMPEWRNHRVKHIRELSGDHDVYCLSVPEAGNFALEAGVFVHNCGIVANVTPLEPGWEGHVTLELSNTTPLPAKVYANEGIVQLLFFQGERPEVTYADRKGKYQGQLGVTLPKL